MKIYFLSFLLLISFLCRSQEVSDDILKKQWSAEEIETCLVEAGIVDSLVSLEKDYTCEVFMEKGGRGRAQQGLEIYGNYIFSFEDAGHVNVYDWRTQDSKPIAGFELESSRPDNHVNNTEFGIEKAKGSKFPLLYISNGKVGSDIEWTCFVESIELKKGNFTSKIVQEIILDGNGWESKNYESIFGAPSWLVDRERGFLWVFSAKKRTVRKVTHKPSDNMYIATKFRIPKLKEGRVVKLGVNDILDQVLFPFDVWFTQAGCISNGQIFYGFGIGAHDPTRPSCIRVYDTDRHIISARYDLNDDIIYEIEDIVLRDGWLYVNTNNSPKRTKSNPLIYKLSLPMYMQK